MANNISAIGGLQFDENINLHSVGIDNETQSNVGPNSWNKPASQSNDVNNQPVILRSSLRQSAGEDL